MCAFFISSKNYYISLKLLLTISYKIKYTGFNALRGPYCDVFENWHAECFLIAVRIIAFTSVLSTN